MSNDEVANIDHYYEHHVQRFSEICPSNAVCIYMANKLLVWSSAMYIPQAVLY